MGPLCVDSRWRGLPSSYSIPWCWSFDRIQLVLELCTSCRSFLLPISIYNKHRLTIIYQIIAIITPYLVDEQYANLSSKIFFMWGSLCIISVLFAFFLVPETKGLSLEQIDRMLEEVSPRKSRSWVPHSTFASEMGLVEKGAPGPIGKGGESAEDTEIETRGVPKETV
jgi:hypothetical protein